MTTCAPTRNLATMNPQSQKLVASGPQYVNNERDKGNKQRKRKANSGDMSVRAFSHGRGVQKAAATLIKAPNMLLTGKTRRIDKKNLTIAAAKQTQLICAKHALKYITPLTATTDNAQFLAMEEAGLFEADVVGLDLEWETSKPVPNQEKTFAYLQRVCVGVVVRQRDGVIPSLAISRYVRVF